MDDLGPGFPWPRRCIVRRVGGLRRLRKQPVVSDYHLHGFARLSTEANRFVSIISVAAFVPDSVLVALLENDRVAARLAELESGVSGEHERLSLLPAPFWKRLASLGYETAPALRSDTLRVVTVAAGYIYNTLPKDARQCTLRSAVGNVKANLQPLTEDVSVQDTVACNAKQFLHLGFNREALENAILLFRLGQRPRSSNSMGRLPPSTGAIPGMALSSCAPALSPKWPGLWRKQTQQDKLLAKQAPKSEKLKRKAPQRVSRRRTFLRVMVLGARQWLAGRGEAAALHPHVLGFEAC